MKNTNKKNFFFRVHFPVFIAENFPTKILNKSFSTKCSFRYQFKDKLVLLKSQFSVLSSRFFLFFFSFFSLNFHFHCSRYSFFFQMEIFFSFFCSTLDLVLLEKREKLFRFPIFSLENWIFLIFSFEGLFFYFSFHSSFLKLLYLKPLYYKNSFRYSKMISLQSVLKLFLALNFSSYRFRYWSRETTHFAWNINGD